ncbi:ATP-binding cassette domain-containing protein [Leptospira biflexa]|uniref:ABC transporter ATP-binding protein n=1 Tax=Leptospira biflexa TaxID=172 RepID=UPI001090EE6D|nr:ABC transporter ATP-binding protein [Leptospira biflexa]TGM44548.1 ATP-binding cassette domain-containing protein [Leptospira biflexa]TGM45411.1 ATP-binding cassette domain-containing protein [Leptospira biflexa]
MNKFAISVEGLSKTYQLGSINHGTLFQDLQSAWAKWRGKEDPNAKVGEKNSRLVGNHFKALSDINLEFQKGERVGIIGRNGAGKSTLLKILSRITNPSEGRIRINGRIASLLEVGTGFHPELTGRENVFLNGAILGMRKEEILRKFDEIVDFSGVEEFIDTPVKRYSSGMYVRLAFAVAAHLEPDIMVVDEVLAVGDAVFQKKCLGKMDSVSKDQGRLVIFVSHSMDAITTLCSRSILLDEGRVKFDGDTSAAVSLYLDALKSDMMQKSSQEASLTFPIEREINHQILSFGIETADKQNFQPFDKPFDFTIKYKVNGRISNLVVDLRILKDGETILLTCIGDRNENFREQHEPGIYEAKVTIPAIFLPVGNYIAQVTMHVPQIHPHGIYNPGKGIQFKIHQEGTNLTSSSYLAGWSGRILLSEPWKINRITI